MEPFPLTPASFSGQARVAPPDAAFSWLRQGWATFVANPGQWLAMAVLLIVVFLGLQIVPLIGTLAANLMMPVLGAGMLHAVRRLSDEGRFEIVDLFAGFKRNTGPLVIVGALYMGGWLIIALVVMVLIGGSVAGGIVFGAAGQPAMGAGIGFGGMFIAGILTLLLGAPLLMAVWFAPALVYFNDMQPVAALKASFDGCLRNWLVMTIFGLILLVLAFFAALPMGLGFLVLLPVVYGALYASYQDIYLG
jgi:uncharacterized membrane protein